MDTLTSFWVDESLHQGGKIQLLAVAISVLAAVAMVVARFRRHLQAARLSSVAAISSGTLAAVMSLAVHDLTKCGETAVKYFYEADDLPFAHERYGQIRILSSLLSLGAAALVALVILFCAICRDRASWKPTSFGGLRSGILLFLSGVMIVLWGAFRQNGFVDAWQNMEFVGPEQKVATFEIDWSVVISDTMPWMYASAALAALAVGFIFALPRSLAAQHKPAPKEALQEAASV